MAELVDGRNDQLVEDSFSMSMAEDPVDDASVLAGMGAPEVGMPANTEQAGPVREGTDVTMARLAETDPMAHDMARNFQADMSRMQNEHLMTQREMLDTLKELRALPSGETPEAEAGSGLPEGITDDHLSMFQSMAEHFGYIPRQELADEKIVEARESYAEEALRRGVYEHGEAFGTIGADGNVLVNPAVQERMRMAEERLTDPNRGLTALELYNLEIGRPAAAVEAAPPRRGVPQPNVARRSTGGGEPVSIYDPARGDSRDDVFARAFVLTKKELGG